MPFFSMRALYFSAVATGMSLSLVPWKMMVGGVVLLRFSIGENFFQ